MINSTIQRRPCIVAIDPLLTMLKTNTIRKADREMLKKGYPVFPSLIHSMKTLTKRAISLTHTLRVNGLIVIEAHPASTRKAIGMPIKDWEKLQTLPKQIGLEEDLEIRALTTHEIDAITAVMTAHLHLPRKTREIGEKRKAAS